jgi:HEAT repeat protein
MRRLLLLAGLLLLMMPACQPEPALKGKSLSVWRQELKSTDPTTRLQAVGAFTMFGSKAKVAVPDLIEALHDNFYAVRAEAAAALGSMGQDARPAVPDLEALLKDNFLNVRVHAANALKEIAPEAAAKADVKADQDTDY